MFPNLIPIGEAHSIYTSEIELEKALPYSREPLWSLLRESLKADLS